MNARTSSFGRILVAEQDPTLSSVIERTLERRGHTVAMARDGHDAMAKLQAEHFHMVLASVELPGIDGWSLLDHTRMMTDPPLVLLLGGTHEVRDVVAAMKRGAYDYVAAPLDFAEIAARTERALETSTLRKKLAASARGDSQDEEDFVCVCESPAMASILGLADRIARTPSSSALILGESGVGKEVVASYIHRKSARRAAPFIRVNLAAMPEAMVEGELFGSVRGAFTDSKRDRVGLFGSADRGTLLLDELCEFRIDLQPKLLRAIEERRFHPVGSDRERSVDVRILAATNRDPEEMIAAQRLRQDLYFRLATVELRIPPLRDRAEDILPLARFFVSKFGQSFGRTGCELAPSAERILLEHPWPGNVRELRNAVERAIMLSDPDELTAETFEASLRKPISSRPPPSDPLVREIPAPHARSVTPMDLSDDRKQALGIVERNNIERALTLSEGSKTRAAKLLSISRTTLWEKMRRYGIR